MEHPKTIEGINAPWLTDVLREAGVLQRAAVRAVDVRAIGEGVGFLSGRARVTISYKDYSREEAWHDYRLSAIMATLNPVLVHYMFKTGGVRGTALGAAMTERFFCDLVECGAEAVVP
jgi:hypothetical protein